MDSLTTMHPTNHQLVALAACYTSKQVGTKQVLLYKSLYQLLPPLTSTPLL
jgi:hypothetical protein